MPEMASPANIWTLLADYKKVADYHKGTGLVGTEYFSLKSKERKEKRLLPPIL